MRKLFFALTLLLSWQPPGLFAQQTRRLDTTTFVVLGEGLAAGMANYGLNEVVQSKSFPAQMARQMNTAFPQPLIEGPGLGDVLGYQSLPVRIPAFAQGRVRVFPERPDPDDEAPTLFVFNLSVPNLPLSESLTRKPVSPLVHNDDPHQTAINLILGFPSMILERDVPLWTQFEYAKAMVPSVALVELGYFEVLAAAVARDPTLIPDRASFRDSYAQIVRGLREMYVEVIVTTIPDPMDTAYFSTPASIARLTRVPDSFIRDFYGLAPGDYVTRNGLTVIGNQFIRRNIQPLPSDVILRANQGPEFTNRVRALNEEINAVARENGAVVYDLAGLFNRIRTTGFTVGSTRITGDYFGGFYSLDGYYPGVAGHGIIANEILSLLNRTYAENFPLLDLSSIVQEDAVTKFAPAREPDESMLEFQRLPRWETE